MIKKISLQSYITDLVVSKCHDQSVENSVKKVF